ncbi:MAG: YajQ family cyclic di-GMP-binding protein [Cytophagales bacterium]|nr:MAG: YajQ family cyclic di-GMP-binding protein [Cytophagales bacterium]
MPSFDISSKVDAQTMDNALNVTRKELQTRYDFRETKTEIEFNKKDNQLLITTETDMRIKAIEDILMSRMAKQGLDSKSLEFTKEAYASGAMMKKEIKIKNGIDKDSAKKIVKDIKESQIKVSTAQMDDIIRVTGKKIDDLQAVISFLRKNDYGLPLQFINMKN